MSIGFSFTNGVLHCDGGDIRQGITPCYIYSAKQAVANYERFVGNVACVDKIVAFSIKSCNDREVISALIAAGSGIDCVSLGEMKRAFECGVEPKKIVLAGVGKTDEEIEFAIKMGILQINVESAEEMLIIDEIAEKLGKIASVALRVNPHLKNENYTHDKITTGKIGNKFGIDITGIPATLSKLKQCTQLKFMGFSCHIGSQILDVSLFEDAFEILTNLVLETEKEGFEFTTLDFGGGIGIDYSSGEELFDFARYASAVKKCLNAIKSKPVAIFEPGRYISASAAILLTKVLYIKNTSHTKFAIIDAGMNNLIRPAMYGSHHNIAPVVLNSHGKIEEYKVVGPICESSDIFGNYTMQELKRGDILAIFNAGAYGEVMASSYNLR
jgi:diaminopimelate decarboxylase